DPHVAPDVPEKRNLAVIDVRQVDAGGEYAAAFKFRVLDEIAAQYTDVAQWIENSEVSRRFSIVERVVVLGIEEARVLHGDHCRPALPLHLGRTEINDARFDEFRAPRERLRSRQQHGVAEMH